MRTREHSSGQQDLAAQSREELDRVLRSEAFQNADRQQELLSYIFNATIEERERDLLGKVIAEKLFGIDPTSTREFSTVRVEIGRLRRRLHAYYASEGARNPVIFDIPKGGYGMSFTEGSNTDGDNGRSGLWAVVGALAGVGCLAIILVFYLTKNGVETAPDPISPQFTENTEAYILFFEARRIGNPPVVKARVEAALTLAKEIQDADPSFAGGYAAESIQLWNYVMFGHSDDPALHSKHALELARQAVVTDPEFSWSQHSLGQSLHLNRDVNAAVEALQRAVDLNPTEADHQGYLGLMLALAGKSDRSISSVSKALELNDSVRTPYRNVLGIANLLAGNFEEAVSWIDANRSLGGPSGPHMLTFLAASYALAGNDGHAQAIGELLRNDQSGFDPTKFLDRLIQMPYQRGILRDGLRRAGLRDEGATSGSQ